MQTEKITIHTETLPDGTQVPYARVLRQVGHTTIGQSLSLHRLSIEQRELAGRSYPELSAKGALPF